MGLASRTIHTFKEKSIREVLDDVVSFGYNKLRTVLPKTDSYVRYHGVQIERHRIGDTILPIDHAGVDDEDYESALISGLVPVLKNGDDVVIIGGGRGVTAIKAAEIVGQDGSVTVYEAAKTRIDAIENAVSLNGFKGQIDVRHGKVGGSGEVIGRQGNADIIPVSKIPDCDVLELDCEGGELEIINSLERCPSSIVVEAHGVYGVPEEKMRNCLKEMGYSIIQRGVENDEDEVIILTAELAEDS